LKKLLQCVDAASTFILEVPKKLFDLDTDLKSFGNNSYKNQHFILSSYDFEIDSSIIITENYFQQSQSYH
jgi:hypothetical protein